MSYPSDEAIAESFRRVVNDRGEVKPLNPHFNTGRSCLQYILDQAKLIDASRGSQATGDA